MDQRRRGLARQRDDELPDPEGVPVRARAVRRQSLSGQHHHLERASHLRVLPNEECQFVHRLGPRDGGLQVINLGKEKFVSLIDNPILRVPHQIA